MNKAMLVGRITKDPELKNTESGTAVVSFTLAVDRAYKDANGEKQCDFINCVAWKNQAEFIAKYIKKGNALGIVGQIQTRKYNDKTFTEILVENVENLTPKNKVEDDGELPF